MEESITLAFIFILGTIIGSFLNVLTLRHNTGLGFIRRSFCFSCGKRLSWYELVPLVSFFIQEGRCRNCKSTISLQYPLVEFISGILFVLVWNYELGIMNYGSLFDGTYSLFLILNSIYLWLVWSLLLAIAVYDIRHKIIPNHFVYFFVVLALLSVFGTSFSDVSSFKFQVSNLLAGPLLAAPFVFLWLVSKGRWMGLGDAKLFLGIGWFLGLQEGIAAFLLSFWAGGLYGVILILISRLLPLKNKSFTGMCACISALCRGDARTHCEICARGGALLSSKEHPGLHQGTNVLRLGARFFTIKGEIPFAPFLILGAFLAFFFDISFSDIESFFTLPLSLFF